MNIIFEYNHKKIVLPVNPEKLVIKRPSASNKVEIIGIGEVSVPQTRKLATLSINSFFWGELFDNTFLFADTNKFLNYLPNSLSSRVEEYAKQKGKEVVSKLSQYTERFTQNEIVQGAYNSFMDDSLKFQTVHEYVDWFTAWQDSLTPARLTVVSKPNEPKQYIDMYVTCEGFDSELRAGEENDYYFELEMLEWRDYGAKTLESKQNKNGKVTLQESSKERLSDKEDTPRKIKTTKKDSIWSVAKTYCKNNWKDLVKEEVNSVAISMKPSDISGLTLKIPNRYVGQ